MNNPTFPDNQDVFPEERTVQAHPGLEPLLVNEPIARAFLDYELDANRLKKKYNAIGHGALICVFLVMGALDYRVTIGAVPGWAKAAFAVIAVIGIGLELYLILGGIKDKWLLNRYTAERIRCLKFQAFFTLAEEAPNDLSTAVTAFTARGLDAIKLDVVGRDKMPDFRPSEVRFLEGRSFATWSQPLLGEVVDAYDKLRFEWQERHLQKHADLAKRYRIGSTSIGGAAFIAGAVLAIIELGLSISGRDLWPHFLPPLDFLTLLAFIVSATVAASERGNANRAHAGRYAYYASEVMRLRGQLPSRKIQFFSLAAEMEKNALDEHYSFCRDVRESSYII